jgi:hypothetical protein
VTLLQTISIVSIVIASLCALTIVIHIFIGHRQRMWIMDIVWPVAALYSGPLGLWAYFKLGTLSTKNKSKDQQAKPFYVHYPSSVSRSSANGGVEVRSIAPASFAATA